MRSGSLVWLILTLFCVTLLLYTLGLNSDRTDLDAINEFIRLESEYCYLRSTPVVYDSVSKAIRDSRTTLSLYQFDGGREVGGISNIDDAVAFIDKLSIDEKYDVSSFVKNWILTNVMYDTMGQCDENSEEYYQVTTYLYEQLHYYETIMLTDSDYYIYMRAEAIYCWTVFLIVVFIIIYISIIRKEYYDSK